MGKTSESVCVCPSVQCSMFIDVLNDCSMYKLFIDRDIIERRKLDEKKNSPLSKIFISLNSLLSQVFFSLEFLQADSGVPINA